MKHEESEICLGPHCQNNGRERLAGSAKQRESKFFLRRFSRHCAADAYGLTSAAETALRPDGIERGRTASAAAWASAAAAMAGGDGGVSIGGGCAGGGRDCFGGRWLWRRRAPASVATGSAALHGLAGGARGRDITPMGH